MAPDDCGCGDSDCETCYPIPGMLYCGSRMIHVFSDQANVDRWEIARAFETYPLAKVERLAESLGQQEFFAFLVRFLGPTLS